MLQAKYPQIVPRATFFPPPSVFVNKVFLEHSHVLEFTIVYD